MLDEKSNRYMVYLQNEGYIPKDAQYILLMARKILLGSTIRDVRVSRDCLEFDITFENKENMQKMIAGLSLIGKFIESNKVVEMDIGKHEAMQLAKKYFNSERYWNAHEVMEGVWKKAMGEEKKLLNGLILIAAGLVHYQKDERDICLGILQRAIEKLANADGVYFGLDVAATKGEIEKILESRRVHTFKI